jgi:hypothetical protein
VQLHLIKDNEDGDGDVPESPAAWCARLLFRALVELDGDAAVMHIGQKPYLVAPAGAIEIGECGLTAAAVETLIVEILPDSARDLLRVAGAAHANCFITEGLPGASFTATATRTEGAIGLEIHRLRRPGDARASTAFKGAIRARNLHDDLALPSAVELWSV